MKTRLRVLRAEKEWSQAELAAHVGVARGTINAIETGKYDPSLPLAFKIARVFGKNVEEVFLYPEEQDQARSPKDLSPALARATRCVAVHSIGFLSPHFARSLSLSSRQGEPQGASSWTIPTAFQTLHLLFGGAKELHAILSRGAPSLPAATVRKVDPILTGHRIHRVLAVVLTVSEPSIAVETGNTHCVLLKFVR